jgi:putative ATP-dependent endonuclease of OLD family
MTEADAGGLEAFAPLYVETVRIRNFRGFARCELELEPGLTLLVGQNNAGKSRILRAIALALGGEAAETDDLTVAGDSTAEIDLIFAPLPLPRSADAEDTFSIDVGQRLRGGVQIVREEPLRERFAWRTTIGRSAEGMGARSDSSFLTYDNTTNDWALSSSSISVTREHRDLVAATLVETRRDIVDELARRGSAIRRVLSDLEVDATVRDRLETQLDELGRQIVGQSATLVALRKSLEEIEKAVGSLGRPALTPLPVRLEELARSVSIELDTGTGALPVRLHGAGSRSLASLQVQGVLYDRRLGRDGPALRPHPVTLVEEPEAHLHPQAHLELAGLLMSMSGQVVASTHSSHLVTAVEPVAIRLIRCRDSVVDVVDLGPAKTETPTTHRALRPTLHQSEMEKLKRLVERPFGELVFASALVIGDGATERAFLPIVIRHALGTTAHGVAVVDPESMKSELAIAAVKFAKLVGIPWLLFADSDGPGRDAAATLADGDETRIVWVTRTAGTARSVDTAIEQMLIDFDPALCRDACLRVRPDLDPAESELEMMKGLKGSVGGVLAGMLVEKYPDPSSWPEPLRDLVNRLEGLL